jgi:hypothetical protein
LLVQHLVANAQEAELWALPTLGKTPRRLANVLAASSRRDRPIWTSYVLLPHYGLGIRVLAQTDPLSISICYQHPNSDGQACTRWHEGSIATFKASRRWGVFTVALLLLVNSFTSIALTGQATLLAANDDYGIPANLLQAFSWLDTHSQAADIVLADLDTANTMPQYIHNRVFCGYGNAVNVDRKLKALQTFFDGEAPNQFRGICSEKMPFGSS